jgi:hypothetical protein
MPKTFFALCTNLVYDIRSGYRKLTSILVTVWGEESIPGTESGIESPSYIGWRAGTTALCLLGS